MFTYPDINPIAFSIGPLQIHWYGLMYLLGFLMAWGLAKYRVHRYHLNWSSEAISDLIFYAAVGVIVGGRCGYMLFYDFSHFIGHPLDLFKIWQGGMSFHGGVIGVLVALWLFAKRFHRPFWEVSDFLAPLIPLGLGAGRVGNFINGELWGRPTDVWWGMVFPKVDALPRHPSQLYEFTLEGIILFILVWWYANKPRPAGCVSAVFLMGYAISRLIIEFFREPDIQLGFLAFNFLTMGQLLSIPMFIAGLMIWWIKRSANISSIT